MKKPQLRGLRQRTDERSDSPTFASRSIQVASNVWCALFTRWDWKIDGGMCAVIALACFIDKFQIGGLFVQILNLLALLCLGVILKRNMRTDVKWKDLPDVIRQSRSK